MKLRRRRDGVSSYHSLLPTQRVVTAKRIPAARQAVIPATMHRAWVAVAGRHWGHVRLASGRPRSGDESGSLCRRGTAWAVTADDPRLLVITSLSFTHHRIPVSSLCGMLLAHSVFVDRFSDAALKLHALRRRLDIVSRYLSVLPARRVVTTGWNPRASSPSSLRRRIAPSN